MLARRSQSPAELREYFERVQSLRRAHLDDFDLQVVIADVHEEVVERARALRDGEAKPAPAGAEPLDPKTWRRATFIGLFCTFIILAAFFYLVQAARKSNLLLPAAPAASAKAAPASQPKPAPPPHAILRLYTDLVPGTVSIDHGPSQDLKDGELVLDHLAPGRHTVQVAGRSGNAEFTYDVAGNAAPQAIGDPSASNAMAVLVSTGNGKAQLVTNADNANVLLDGRSAGRAGPGGLTIDRITPAEHELEVTQGKDRQRFILTYTHSPALTVYVKSDPNTGTIVLVTHQDKAEVFLNGVLYRRRTSRGQLRIPLKAGEYTIRVHKAGFIDPPPETVSVKRDEETALAFSLQPVPQIATLAIRGALPGTMVYVDKDLAAVIGSDGQAIMSNIKPGLHAIVLRREQAVPKRFERTFHTGDVITLSGPDVMLAKTVVHEPSTALPVAAAASANTVAPDYNIEIKGVQVRRGGGFVPYRVPGVAGHYSFMALARKSGFLKHAKVQWYAGYRDAGDYVLFTLDGRHATVREIHAGKSFPVARAPFSMDAREWVQVYMQVQPKRIDVHVKTPDSKWVDIGGPRARLGQDFTKGKVGFYIPGKDELAISDFRFSNR